MIQINIEKAKTVAHVMRRESRSAEFAPLDIKATIPSEAESAEAQRANIRLKYEQIQLDINNATNVETLKTIVSNL